MYVKCGFPFKYGWLLNHTLSFCLHDPPSKSKPEVTPDVDEPPEEIQTLHFIMTTNTEVTVYPVKNMNVYNNRDSRLLFA